MERRSVPLGKIKASQLGLHWLLVTLLVTGLLWIYATTNTQIYTALTVIFVIASLISFIKVQSLKTIFAFLLWTFVTGFILTHPFEQNEMKLFSILLLSLFSASMPAVLYQSCRQTKWYFNHKYSRSINVIVGTGEHGEYFIAEQPTGSPVFYLIVAFFCMLPGVLFGLVLYAVPADGHSGSKMLFLFLCLLSGYGTLKYLKKALHPG